MGRTVEFIPDGARVRVSPQEVADCWRMHCPTIPAQYAVGTGDHESSLTINERDTELSGFVSIGVFQLSQDECDAAGMSSANLLTLEDSCAVMAVTARRRLSLIMGVAGLASPKPDCWAYLSIAHNQGPGAAQDTIKAHGCNWAAYQQRNHDEAQAALDAAQASEDPHAIAIAKAKLQWWLGVFAYGNDCITGGARWKEVALH